MLIKLNYVEIDPLAGFGGHDEVPVTPVIRVYVLEPEFREPIPQLLNITMLDDDVEIRVAASLFAQ